MIVSVQQAAMNALAGYLGQQLSGVVIEPQWPVRNRAKPDKSITIAMSGARQDLPILKLLSSTNAAPTGASSVWQVAFCRQPFQLDVWAESDVERDDLVARLDDALHAGESTLTGVYNPDVAGNGVLLQLADGWDLATADYTFSGPENHDYDSTVGRNIYRAAYSGDATFMLTVTRTTPRQQVIRFISNLDPGLLTT